jgi:regulator of RNase E activity RraA
MEIQPGDLLHGDENGSVNVPMDIAEAVVEKARKVRDTEAKLFEYLGSQSVTLEGLKSHVGRPTNA